MAKRILGKVVWLGRTTATVMGLAVVLAVVFGVATTALAAVPGDPFRLGQVNTINALTSLVGSVNNPMLRVDNNNTGASATALDLQVQPGKAPMKVNSATRVTNLNADRLDGKDFSAFDAQEVLDTQGPLPKEGTYTSKGGTLVLSFSGSGFRSTQREGYIAMDVYVDGNYEDSAFVFTNERISHKAFVSEVAVVKGLPAGQHTIRLEAFNDTGICGTPSESPLNRCTSTNSDDIFAVTVIEIPD